MDIKDDFPDEHILAAYYDLIPWVADIVNFLGSDVMPDGLNSYQIKKYIYEARKFYRDEP